jgi:hypothetical protein
VLGCLDFELVCVKVPGHELDWQPFREYGDHIDGKGLGRTDLRRCED